MTSFAGGLRWPRLYAGMTLVGAGLGLLVVLGLLPRVPHQLTAWMHSVDPALAALAVVVAGAMTGFFLTGVAHLGVRWQLRRRSSSS
jgi:hypothetical protein